MLSARSAVPCAMTSSSRVSDDNKTILGVKNACAIGAEKFNHQRLPGRVKRPG